MATLLKDEFNPVFLKSVGESIGKQYSDFDTKSLVTISKTKNWADLGLKERMRASTLKINELLPFDYSKQMDILEPAGSEFRGLQGMLFPDFVEVFGVDHPKRSLQALEYLTEFSTGEFAIRPLVIHHRDMALDMMKTWTKSSNEHHRRLASEGCRPRLPWGAVLRDFVEDPTPSLNILELLKNDDSKYVQKSVANNLNDISKDHPDKVISLVKRWGLKNKNTAWILKHASRTMLKQGNQEILKIFGYKPSEHLKIDAVSITPNTFTVGDKGHFLGQLKNTDSKDLNFRAEYIVHYPRKQSSEDYQKVFYIKEGTLKSNKSIELKGKLDFEEKSTRKIYAGSHKLSIQINGKTIYSKTIDVN